MRAANSSQHIKENYYPIVVFKYYICAAILHRAGTGVHASRIGITKVFSNKRKKRQQIPLS